MSDKPDYRWEIEILVPADNSPNGICYWGGVEDCRFTEETAAKTAFASFLATRTADDWPIRLVRIERTVISLI